jgi:outer membrane protein TolC
MVLASDSGASQDDWNHSEDGTVAHAEKFREEIQTSLQQSQSEKWRASELIGFYWPKFSLASIGTQEDGERTATYGLILRWSLLDGGIKAAEAANRRAAAKTYALKAQSSRLQVAAEVRQAYIRFAGASLNVENSAAEVTNSWNAFYGAIQLFGANKIEATTLIQTQAQLVNAITDFEMAQRLRNTGLAELYR